MLLHRCALEQPIHTVSSDGSISPPIETWTEEQRKTGVYLQRCIKEFLEYTHDGSDFGDSWQLMAQYNKLKKLIKVDLKTYLNADLDPAHLNKGPVLVSKPLPRAKDSYTDNECMEIMMRAFFAERAHAAAMKRQEILVYDKGVLFPPVETWTREQRRLGMELQRCYAEVLNVMDCEGIDFEDDDELKGRNVRMRKLLAVDMNPK